ncbi:2-oxo acid dehydrogenase subunit E2 [Sedimenticola sp.]|uniref:2-oxo acid dehydrogenase subunit E2 n=1 Tax=Sedimenticola sp. TaxID=1940285 RepID=UPI002FF69017
MNQLSLEQQTTNHGSNTKEVDDLSHKAGHCGTIEGGDSIQNHPMTYVTLTIDHRVLDAYQANRIMESFVRVIENRDD